MTCFILEKAEMSLIKLKNSMNFIQKRENFLRVQSYEMKEISLFGNFCLNKYN